MEDYIFILVEDLEDDVERNICYKAVDPKDIRSTAENFRGTNVDYMVVVYCGTRYEWENNRKKIGSLFLS